MHEAIARHIRAWQTHFPWFIDLKFSSTERMRRLLRKPAEPEYAVMRHLPVPPGSCLVNVGANRGQTIHSMRLYHADAPIRAYEPNLALADRLVRTFAGDPHVRIEAYGLGAENSAMTLFVPYYRNWMFDALASVHRESAAGWLNARTVAGFRPELLRIEELECEIRRMDDQDLAPAIITMDVQGHEESVLEGGRKTLITHEPIIILENDPKRGSPAILAELGYREFNMEDGVLHPARQMKKDSIFATLAGIARLKAHGAVFSSDGDTAKATPTAAATIATTDSNPTDLETPR